MKHLTYPAILSLMLMLSGLSCKTPQQTTAHSSTFVGTYWRLGELRGKPVTPSGKAEFYLKLNKEDGHFTAFAGCNRIMGSYEVTEPNKVTFSKMAGTLMACPDMATESDFMKVLGEAQNYVITDHILALTKPRTANLARFIEAEQPKEPKK
jgi:heat shock protein HslJ